MSIVDPTFRTAGQATPGGPGGGVMAKRKQHTAAFKAQVALAALKGDKTVNEVAAQFGVHPTLIHDWKKKLLAGAAAVFEGSAKTAPAADAQQAELFEQIGRLKMELGGVKKKAAASRGLEAGADRGVPPRVNLPRAGQVA